MAIHIISFQQSNILIDEGKRPRICDYGLAFIIEPSEFTSIKTAGACRWTAPEIMNPPEDTVYADDSVALFTRESDVYAFSMTVIEVNTI
jgi:serine/threonine protein kinase